ncbi:MAG: DUF2244 domain-containing protein [Xanthomonadaceae bacterium]|nr:DUF2244 domain-containing protein [Xanthomonadaceae bacterium]
MVRNKTGTLPEPVARIEVLANLSLTLDRLAGFFLVLSAFTLTVALLPTLMGFWPILAIAIVHLAIVGWCFRLAWLGNWARQDIMIDRERVSVRYRTARAEQEVSWPSSWVRLRKRHQAGELHIYLAHHGKEIEIGGFVPASERQEAAKFITDALAPYSAWHVHGLKR